MSESKSKSTLAIIRKQKNALMSTEKKLEKCKDDLTKNLLENMVEIIHSTLFTMLDIEVKFYLKELNHFHREEKRRLILLLLDANNYPDIFVANQIGFLKVLQEEINMYEELISFYKNETFVTSFLDVKELNDQIFKLIYELNEKSNALFNRMYTLLGDRINEVQKMVATGEIKDKPFKYIEISLMAERQLSNWNPNHKLDELFKFGEYLAILADSLEEDEEAINLMDKNEEYNFKQAKQLIESLRRKVQEEIEIKKKNKNM